MKSVIKIKKNTKQKIKEQKQKQNKTKQKYLCMRRVIMSTKLAFFISCLRVVQKKYCCTVVIINIFLKIW